MKILTIAGTRPELIRLSIIIEKLDKLVAKGYFEHIFIYTNQNYDYDLSTSTVPISGGTVNYLAIDGGGE